MFRPRHPLLSVPAFSSDLGTRRLPRSGRGVGVHPKRLGAFGSLSNLCSGGSSDPFPRSFAPVPSLPAFSPATPVGTRRNRRKSFLFIDLLHNSRTTRGWGRHPRAFSPLSQPARTILFGFRTCKETAHNRLGIRTPKTQHIKSFRIRTYKKTQRGGGSYC
jgi:hypothetical protein